MLDRRVTVSPTSKMQGFFNALKRHIHIECAPSYGCHIRNFFCPTASYLSLLQTDMTAVSLSITQQTQETMLTTIATPSAGRTAGQSLRAYVGQVINRISSLSERTFLKLGGAGTVMTIISAGRYSATGTGSDAVLLAVASITSLCLLAKADGLNQRNKSNVSK